MNYIIVEAQTTGTTTTVVTPIPVYSDPVEAEAVFLEKCAYARRSGLDTHSVTLMDEEGKVVARKHYKA